MEGLTETVAMTSLMDMLYCCLLLKTEYQNYCIFTFLKTMT